MYIENEKKVVVGLCEGRHPLPVEGYIFEGNVNPLDFDGMSKTVREFLNSHVGVSVHSRTGLNQHDMYTDVSCYVGDAELVVYVTGLTACTAAVISECAYNGVPLTLMHFNRDTGDYIPQKVIW